MDIEHDQTFAFPAPAEIVGQKILMQQTLRQSIHSSTEVLRRRAECCNFSVGHSTDTQVFLDLIGSRRKLTESCDPPAADFSALLERIQMRNRLQWNMAGVVAREQREQREQFPPLAFAVTIVANHRQPFQKQDFVAVGVLDRAI